MPNFNALVVGGGELNTYIRDGEIWSTETRNIPLSYGTKHISIS